MYYILNMNKFLKILRIIFHISVLFLIIISLFPGSIINFIFYGELIQTKETTLFVIETWPNHLASYLYISILGFYIYLKHKKFNLLIFFLIFLAISLESLQFLIPNRSFEISDLSANITGVILGYLIIKIYRLVKKK